MKRHSLFAVLSLVALFAFRDLAWSQTVPLNTGYDHSAFARYPPVPPFPQTMPYPPVPPDSQTKDDYWITIASFPNLPVAPSWVLWQVPPPDWAAALPSTNWIGPRKTYLSANGTTPENPSYALFRKCFCLLANFKNASLSLRLRADDRVQVWLNTVTTQLVTPKGGNHSGGPLVFGSTQTQSHFQAGRNCLYVLVEDTFGGATGFDLAGSVSALGLLPVPAAGVAQTFGPCQCGGSAQPGRTAEADDQKVIAEIVKLAEKRRLEKKAPK